MKMAHRQAAWLAAAAALLLGMVAPAHLREAKVAGQFYPDDPAELRELVDEFLQRQPEPAGKKPRILIVPHAGYQYSGLVAANAYRQLQGHRYDGVVVVGFTHRVSFPSVSVDTVEAYHTPLGEIPVDQEAVAILRTLYDFASWEPAHEAGEHSLEVQLPFLQVVFDRVRIVPILMGTFEPEVADRVAAGLQALSRLGDYLFIFTTDLSHYHPYDEAEKKDEATVDAILRETPEAVHRLFGRDQIEACGHGPILAGLKLAASLGYPPKVLLQYANSGDTAGTPKSVVGYAAIAMYEPMPAGPHQVSAEAGAALVAAARGTLEARIGKQDAASAPNLHLFAELSRPSGVFVTLRKHGQLRGCIGRLQPSGPLAELLPEVAMDATLRDARFEPVTADELRELQVEVSVLTTPVKVNSADDIVPGRDGVILEHAGHSGVFLPQVWGESGWTKVEFLSELASQKAGLPRDAWQQADLYVFQDQAFAEPGTDEKIGDRY